MYSLSDLQNIVKISDKAIIYKDAGFIVGPISLVLGIVINFIFNIMYGIDSASSLGWSIIMFTLFSRILMLPLVHKQMDSMRRMQEIGPLTNEIKEKYKGKTDQESKQKEAMEIQKLYQENKINPFGGCLPMFIQMPIFFALNQIIRNAYLYVDKINDVFTNISVELAKIPDYYDLLGPLILPKLSKGVELDMATTEGLNKAINVFSANDWAEILANAPTDVAANLYDLLIVKNNIDTFWGMNLSENPTLTSISILIPVLSVITTFLTSWLSMKSAPQGGDPAQAQTQKVMMYMMPVMMGFISFSLTAGVGLYWITSSIFQVFQQLYMNNKRDKMANANIIEGKEISRNKTKKKKKK